MAEELVIGGYINNGTMVTPFPTLGELPATFKIRTTVTQAMAQRAEDLAHIVLAEMLRVQPLVRLYGEWVDRAYSVPGYVKAANDATMSLDPEAFRDAVWAARHRVGVGYDTPGPDRWGFRDALVILHGRIRDIIISGY